MLHKMAFHLSNKLVALHLDESTAKAYVCNQDGAGSSFLSRVACSILNLADKHGITVFPVYLTYPSQYGSQLSLLGLVGS